MRTIGILGGHSALASSVFHARLIDRLRQRGVVDDAQYPNIAHLSMPLQGLDDEGLAGGVGARSLDSALTALESLGSEATAVICNSLHDLVNVVCAQGAHAPTLTPVHAVNELTLPGKVLVLAAGNARRYQMVQPQCDQLDYTSGQQQQWIADFTAEVRRSGCTPGLSEALVRKLESFAGEGYDHLVLACTELSALVPDACDWRLQQAACVDAMSCLLDRFVSTPSAG